MVARQTVAAKGGGKKCRVAKIKSNFIYRFSLFTVHRSYQTSSEKKTEIEKLKVTHFIIRPQKTV